MDLNEAIQSCKKGNFVTHEYFDSKQSMHMYNNALYYEDGADLSNQMDWIRKHPIYKKGWSIKYESSKVDMDMLKDMHIKNSRYMLQSDTYEKCIKKDRV